MSQNNYFSTLESPEDLCQRPLPAIHSMGSLPALLRSYSKILGWNMRFVPLDVDSLPVDLAQALKSELNKIQTSEDPQFPSFSSFASALREQSSGKPTEKDEKTQPEALQEKSSRDQTSRENKKPFSAASRKVSALNHDDLPKSSKSGRSSRKGAYSEESRQQDDAATFLKLYTDWEDEKKEGVCNSQTGTIIGTNTVESATEALSRTTSEFLSRSSRSARYSQSADTKSEFRASEYSPAMLPSQRPPQPIPVEIKGANGKPVIVGSIVYSPMDDLWSNLHALARQAAVALADMVAELLETRYQLWRREAELATKSVGPLDPRLDQQLAFVFQDILRTGADCLKCQAAAMYLLDDDTSCLKMRSCWGLPAERLQEPPRSLVTALADLEAMVGHVVVLEDTRELDQWQAPEDFPSAICVPLISESTILGTAWFFSQKRRTFTDAQTRVAEIVAGRLTGEMERAAVEEKAIERTTAENLDWKKDVQDAATIQKNQLPVCAPWMVGWDLSASAYHSQQIGGNFYDWFSLANGQAVVALGDCQQRGLTGAMVCEAVKTALRCHAGYLAKVDSLMEQVDRTIWSSSAADQYANLFTAIVQPDSDLVRYTTAGNVRLIRVTARGWEDLSEKRPLLGQTAQTQYSCRTCEVRANEALLVLSSGVGKKYQTDGAPLNWNEFLECVKGILPRSAKAIARELKGYLDVQCPYPSQTDYSLLVIKRKN